jgi:hypothetical protein
MTPEPPKPREWRWYTYLLVAITVSFFTIVAWPVLKEWWSARLVAKADPPAPEAAPPNPAPPRTDELPVAPPPHEKDNLGEKMPPAGPGKEVPPVPPVVGGAAPAPMVVAEAKYRDVVIDEPFDQFFAKKKTLMDTSGVREFPLTDGKYTVVCIVQAKLHTDTAAARVEAEEVCENKMAAAVLAWKKGLETERKRETGETLDSKIVTAMKGHVRVLPVVGRWTSAKGDVLYMAYGQVFTEKELRP